MPTRLILNFNPNPNPNLDLNLSPSSSVGARGSQTLK